MTTLSEFSAARGAPQSVPRRYAGRGHTTASGTHAVTPSDTPAATVESELAMLVGLAAAGDRGAWERIVSRYVSLVYAIALQHGIDECSAADVVQTTWLRLFQHIDEIRDPSRIGAWLATTARRESLRIVVAQNRYVLEDKPEVFDRPDPLSPANDERLLAEERGRRLQQAVDALPPSWQSLVRLLMRDPPVSYKEIAEELEMPVGSIGPTRRRCISRIRAALESAPS
jgi:RNA polymerase sigma factor (sigma-70 family)